MSKLRTFFGVVLLTAMAGVLVAPPTPAAAGPGCPQVCIAGNLEGTGQLPSATSGTLMVTANWRAVDNTAGSPTVDTTEFARQIGIVAAGVTPDGLGNFTTTAALVALKRTVTSLGVFYLPEHMATVTVTRQGPLMTVSSPTYHGRLLIGSVPTAPLTIAGPFTKGSLAI